MKYNNNNNNNNKKNKKQLWWSLSLAVFYIMSYITVSSLWAATLYSHFIGMQWRFLVKHTQAELEHLWLACDRLKGCFVPSLCNMVDQWLGCFSEDGWVTPDSPPNTPTHIKSGTFIRCCASLGNGPVKTDKTSHSTLLSFGLIRARFSSNELQISGFRQLKQHSVFLSWWPWKEYSNKGWSGLSYESDLCVTFLINKIIFGNLVLSPVTPYTHILSSRRDVPPWDTIKMEPTGGCWAGGRVVRII